MLEAIKALMLVAVYRHSQLACDKHRQVHYAVVPPSLSLLRENLVSAILPETTAAYKAQLQSMHPEW